MTPQERDVIAGIFDRLRQAADQPRDPEAEGYIAQRLREQPYAPYAMAQAVYVQEQSLLNLQQQIEALQAEVKELQARVSEPQPAASGGFLSGIFGGGAPQPRAGSVPSFPQRASAAEPQPAGQPSSAWNRPGQPSASQPGMAPSGLQGGPQGQPGPWQNQPGQAPGRGGGFMATALTTAAGVAGGMMLGNVLTNAFGGGKSGEAAKPAETASAAEPAKPDTAAAETANAPAADEGAAAYQPASYEEPMDQGYDDGGFGGDDDSWA